MANRTLDLSTEKSERNEIKPIPQGAYEFEIESASVRPPKNAFKEDGTIALPSVELEVRVFGEGLPEAGRKVFPKPGLYLGLTPGKDGKLNYKRENGLLACFEALGASKPEVEIVDHTAVKDSGEEVTVEMINPQQVAELVNNTLRGQRGKAYIRVKTETFNGKTQTKNELARFIVPTSEGN